MIQYSDSLFGLAVEYKLLFGGLVASWIYAVALELPRSMTMPSHTNHTI